MPGTSLSEAAYRQMRDLERRAEHLADLLADPIMQTLMAADGVTVEQIVAIIERARGELAPRAHDRGDRPDVRAGIGQSDLN